MNTNIQGGSALQSLFWKMIVSIILEKKGRMKMCLSLNGCRDGGV
jgi:hypothetical protein